MTLESQKEQFSNAYLRAITAVAGYTLYKPELDDDSIDWGICARAEVHTVRTAEPSAAHQRWRDALKAIVCDTNVLLSVGPMEVAAYLRSHSWRQERLVGDRGSVAQAGATGDLSPFTQAIASGVSADLCEALAALSLDGAAFDVTIAISWSPTRAVPAKTPDRFQFVSGAMPLLREAARLLAKEGKSSGSASWANLR